METVEKTLPPKWVTFFSYLFCVFLISPIFAISQIYGWGAVSALGFECEAEEGAPLWLMLYLDIFLFLGGLTGLSILLRKTWAYRLGILYSFFGLTIGVTACFVRFDNVVFERDSATSQLILLGAFMYHLIWNRAFWEQATANKRMDDKSLPAPS